MEISEIKSKLEGEKKALSDLETRKKKLDEKISAKKKKVDEYTNLIWCKQYADIDSQLDSLGVSRDELLAALKNNDLSSLQESIKNQTKAKKEEDALVG